MSATAVALPAPPLFDPARLAVAGFLARYAGPTRTAYTTDLRQYFAWCAHQDLDLFAARRGHLELWARSMEERGLARATVGRRLSTVSGFYRFAVVDGLLAHSPAEFVRRPKISAESATLGLDRMELRALIACGAAGSPTDYALACLLELLGLRVSEACSIDVEDLGMAGASYRHRGGQGLQAGRRPPAAPSRPSTRRGRRRAAVGTAAAGPLGPPAQPPRRRPDRAAPGQGGRDHQAHLPALLEAQLHHRLLDAGVPLRDVQIAARHADPRTTTRYDRARHNLDRHASYIVAAFIAGAS